MNLQKISSRLKKFAEENSLDLFTTPEYLTYTANLLFAFASTPLSMDSALSSVNIKDYFSVEKASLVNPDNPYLAIALLAHNILFISSRFEPDEQR